MQKFSYLIILFVAFSFTLNAQNQYVGVKTCGMCHKKAEGGEQLKIWEGSAHAKAFKTLQTAEADKIAGGKAAEDPKCLKCHVTGHGIDASLIGSKFSMEDGVQCETCHGAGSAYKSKKVMEDKAQAVAAGMTDFSEKGSVEKLCKTCHNEGSPTFKEKGFKFDEMWAKIKHPIPAKG